MHTKDISNVRRLQWVSVEDWSEVPETYAALLPFGSKIGEKDIDAFVENLFRDVARKLNIAYADIAPTLQD